MTWFRWFRREKTVEPQVQEDTTELSGEVRNAMQKHASSSRLLRLRALKNLRTLQSLNDSLELRAKAREGIRAADLALKEMDKARHHDDRPK